MQRHEFLYNARLAENSERYSDMITFMKSLIDEANGDINNDERALLAVAYKQAVGQRRAAYRLISGYEAKQKARGADLEVVHEYKARVLKELYHYCNEVISLIDQKLLKDDDETEVKIFYIKMKGDYYRYMSETGESSVIELANEAYNQAFQLASFLPAIHTTVIGLALNYSVFKYEVLKDPKAAIELAQSALDSALGILESSEPGSHKESKPILELLKENLTLWEGEEE